MIVITILSLISLGNVGESIPVPYKDKMVHFTFYFVFVLLWMLFCKNRISSIKIRMIILFSAIGYGILMEICQGFTKDRTPDIYDVFANSSGALFGLLISTFILKKSKATH